MTKCIQLLEIVINLCEKCWWFVDLHNIPSGTEINTPKKIGFDISGKSSPKEEA